MVGGQFKRWGGIKSLNEEEMDRGGSDAPLDEMLRKCLESPPPKKNEFDAVRPRWQPRR